MNRWPGSEPPLVTYGHNLRLNIDGYELEARQNAEDLRLRSQKRLELYANKISPPERTFQATSMLNKLESMDLRYFPADLVSGLERESAMLEAWNVFDPRLGQVLSWQNDLMYWGDGTCLHTLDHDKIVDTLEVGSLIQQVEHSAFNGTSLCLRTRQGFGVLRDEDVYHIFDGDTMHVASSELTSVCCADGKLLLYDSSATMTYSASVPVSGVGWAKTLWLDQSRLLYVSQDSLQTLDTRETEWASLLRTPKTQTFRDAAASGNDVFVMEDYFLAWWDQRMLNKPLLLTEHHLSTTEPSWRLDVCNEFGDSSVVVSSCCHPSSLVLTFGPDYDYPVSKLDPYLLDFYPNVHPQSQLFREGCRYIASTTGGLFKQEFGDEPETEPAADLGDPVPEVVPPQSNDFRWQPVRASRSFECGDIRSAMMAPPVETFAKESIRDLSEFEVFLGHANKFGLPFVQHMAADSAQRQTQEPELKIQGPVDPKLLELMGDWPDPLEQPEPEPEPQIEPEPEPEQTQTQPSSDLPSQLAWPSSPTAQSQMADLLSSQPIHDNLSFSQPLPARKKKKLKRKRAKDGFR